MKIFIKRRTPWEHFWFYEIVLVLSRILDFSLWPNYTVVNISRVNKIRGDSYPQMIYWQYYIKIRVSVTSYEGGSS